MHIVIEIIMRHSGLLAEFVHRIARVDDEIDDIDMMYRIHCCIHDSKTAYPLSAMRGSMTTETMS